MIQNKTEVLNLKSRKTQVPIGYLTLFFKTTFHLDKLSRKEARPKEDNYSFP